MTFRRSIEPTLFEAFDHARTPPLMALDFLEPFDHNDPEAYTLNFTEAFDA